jgi:hypothetical protein
MITGKVLGAYGCIGTLSPTELEPTKQVIWYRRAVDEWGFDHFEVPFVAGAPMAGELADFFAETRSSLVATLMVQWAVTGPGYPEYGLASLDETARQRAFVDAASIVRELVGLQARSIGISHLAVQAGQRMGDPIAHAIAFHRSLVDLDRIVARVLPETILVAENTDTRPSDYPVATPGSKRSALDVDALVQIVGAVNRDLDPGRSVGLMLNWGRLLVDRVDPLATVERALASEAPVVGVILSGARPTPKGLRDSHNSHLDPDSGFAAEDAFACAAALRASPQRAFIGMKCSCAKGDDEFALTADLVLPAQAELLNRIMQEETAGARAARGLRAM